MIGFSLTVGLHQRVEEESLIKNSSACKDYLIEAMKYHLLPADQRALMKTARTRMRTPACCPKVQTQPAVSVSGSEESSTYSRK